MNLITRNNVTNSLSFLELYTVGPLLQGRPVDFENWPLNRVNWVAMAVNVFLYPLYSKTLVEMLGQYM